jgi:protein-L-isoaspartate(D-aspartate) O-methyltransferase
MDHPTAIVAPALAADDYAAARTLMVDSQVRPNKVTDGRVIAAMRNLPREKFLPPHLAALAYADEDVKLPGGRALMEPMVIARLLQIAAPRPGETALVVAAGAGYGAALLAACGVSVTALEEDEALLAIARVALPEFAPAVRLVTGKLGEGWPAGAPYDLVLIEGAVEVVPDAIAAQLRRPGGRVVTVLSGGGRIGCGAVGEAATAGSEALTFQKRFDCATPVLAAFRRTAGFVF